MACWSRLLSFYASARHPWPQTMPRYLALAAAIAIVLAGCGGGADSTEPAATGLRIVAGASISDTVWTRPVQALIVEVHPCPEKAVSDGAQSLTLPGFRQMMNELKPYINLWKESRAALAAAV